MKIMKNNQAKPVVSSRQARLIEAEAHRNGAQNTPIENAISQTEAIFAQKQEQARRESADAIKDLESKKDVANHRRADAETRWQMWSAETGGIVPPVAAPFGKIVAAFAAMTGEAVLLAPLMDLFGVADNVFQFILAGVIVIVLALLVELPIHLWRQNFNRYAVCAAGAIIAWGLVSLGVFRAFGLNAIEAKSSPLISSFLGDNSVLSAVVIAFLTAGLPIGAAFAFETGWHGLSRWHQWRKARRDALKYAKLEKIFVKKLEAEIEKRDKQIAELDQTREAWQSAQRQAHEEGSRREARRRPFWEIAFLLFGGCVLILALVMAFAYIFCDAALSGVIASDLGRFMIYFGLALGAMSVFAYFILKRWNSPTPEQFYADRTVVWSNVQNAPQQLDKTESAKFVLPESATPKISETAQANGNGSARI